MGIYRFLLAIIVAISHMGNLFFGYNPGVVAVISFFILSGYVMTSLVEKYYKNSFNVLGFYLDRAARLFPQFILYFILTSVVIYFVGIDSVFINQLTLGKWLLNIPILPLGFFMYWADGALVMPQAWSLGLEMTFYLVIPWIVRYFSFRSILILMLLSMSVFGAAYCAIINSDWYGYRLLPGTLFMFLLGALFFNKKRIYGLLIISVFVLVGVLFITTFQSESLYNRPYNKEVLLGLLIGIPVVGLLKNLRFSAVDEFFGNLSYGIFLNHFLVIWLMDKFFLIHGRITHAVIIIFISCVFAFVSYLLIERPALRWRHKFRCEPARRFDSSTVPRFVAT